MLNPLFFSFLLFILNSHPDPLKEFHKQLGGNIERYLSPTPDSDSAGTCYHYTELLKVGINKKSKIVSIDLSDSAPEWLVKDIKRQKDDKRIDINKLDSLAKKAGLKNCTLFFPFILESDDFPCGMEKKKRSYAENYFKFKGENLKGNVIFGEQIKAVFSTRYIFK